MKVKLLEEKRLLFSVFKLPFFCGCYGTNLYIYLTLLWTMAWNKAHFLKTVFALNWSLGHNPTVFTCVDETWDWTRFQLMGVLSDRSLSGHCCALGGSSTQGSINGWDATTAFVTLPTWRLEHPPPWPL